MNYQSRAYEQKNSETQQECRAVEKSRQRESADGDQHATEPTSDGLRGTAAELANRGAPRQLRAVQQPREVAVGGRQVERIEAAEDDAEADQQTRSGRLAHGDERRDDGRRAGEDVGDEHDRPGALEVGGDATEEHQGSTGDTGGGQDEAGETRVVELGSRPADSDPPHVVAEETKGARQDVANEARVGVERSTRLRHHYLGLPLGWSGDLD